MIKDKDNSIVCDPIGISSVMSMSQNKIKTKCSMKRTAAGAQVLLKFQTIYRWIK